VGTPIIEHTMRLISGPGVARLIGRSPSWFYQHRVELEKAGFPRRDDLLGGWHQEAISAWLARRARTDAPSPSGTGDDPLRRAIDAHANALRH
jgi:predicted DNA-binding transcriptional regulator AlpA